MTIIALLLGTASIGCANDVKAPAVAVAPTLSQRKIVTVVTVALNQPGPNLDLSPGDIDASLLRTPVPAASASMVGRVIFRAIFTEDGSIEKFTLLSSTGNQFERAAIAAIQSWRYEPSLNGKGVPAEGTITVDFSFSKDTR
jgi:TonB family protein